MINKNTESFMRPVGWLFFFVDDDEPTQHFFLNEREALKWMDSESCMWDGYIEPVYAVADRGNRCDD